MGVAERKKPLQMGWCLSCHKQFQEDPPAAPSPASEWVIPATDTSLIYKINAAANNGEKESKIPAAPALRKAPNDCWECHK